MVDQQTTVQPPLQGHTENLHRNLAHSSATPVTYHDSSSSRRLCLSGLPCSAAVHLSMKKTAPASGEEQVRVDKWDIRRRKLVEDMMAKLLGDGYCFSMIIMENHVFGELSSSVY